MALYLMISLIVPLWNLARLIGVAIAMGHVRLHFVLWKSSV
jgi:hypothetical protein